MKNRPLKTAIRKCRDCARAIGWGADTKDPKGARCYDCSVNYRKGKKP